MRPKKQKISSRLIVAMVTICIYGSIYFILQQSIRSSADDMPKGYAENVKTAIEGQMNTFYNALTTKPTTKMESNNGNFLILYDQNGFPKFSTTTLHGVTPTIPKGVLEHAQKHGINKITWQPEPGVRYATVIIPYSGNKQVGYIVAGNALMPFEEQISLLNISWLVAALAILLAFVADYFTGRANPLFHSIQLLRLALFNNSLVCTYLLLKGGLPRSSESTVTGFFFACCAALLVSLLVKRSSIPERMIYGVLLGLSCFYLLIYIAFDGFYLPL